MDVVNTVEEVRSCVRKLKNSGKKIAFVPTMGALHEGHLSLIRLARQHADAVVVSIYVNPEQFAPNEDFGSYPRTAEADLEKCRAENTDLVFMPDDRIMYGTGEKYFSIEVRELNKYLDGGSRKGFFQGIALVVNKLFNIVGADVAVFGQKDFQQFRILEEMVKEFNHDIKLIMAPVARAGDGLALSSRNAYLSPEERKTAPLLYAVLQQIVAELRNGPPEPEILLQNKRELLKANGFKNDYLGIFDTEKMQPVEHLVKGRNYLAAAAAYLGKTRLIDNIIFSI